MNNNFTQGTIIEDIRSEKYPNIRCKGVIISARCDLEQNKIRQFHCLTALNIEDWIFEVLFANIVEDKKKNVLGNIKKYCKGKNLDFETLLGFDMERAIVTLYGSSGEKEKSDITKVIEEWKKYEELQSHNPSMKEKKAFLKDEGKKLLKNKIHQLYNSAFPKYAFVPQKAYSKKESSVEGIVVDLQDIIQIDIIHRVGIIANEYDYKVLTNREKREELNKIFFFQSDEDFVIADNLIESPWIEYVLQLFANSFIRIGVENASDSEIEDYIYNILEG